MSRSDPSLDPIITRMRQVLLTAKILRKFVSSATTVWNPCRVRNAMTSSSRWSFRSALTVSFHARVSGSKIAISHLSAGEKLKSHAQEAPAQRHNQNHGVRDGIANLTMYGLVVLHAYSHQTHAPDVDGKH